MSYPPSYGAPGHYVSPYGAHPSLAQAPAVERPMSPQDTPEERRYLAFQRLFAGAPGTVGDMLAQWVMVHRCNLVPDGTVARTVAIGGRLAQLEMGSEGTFTLTSPTQTAFFGLAVATRDLRSGAILPTNTDVLMRLTSDKSATLIGSSDHQCSVAPFDPAGHGHTGIAPFMAAAGEKLTFGLRNEGPAAVAVTVNLMGLGLYAGNGQTL